MEVALFETWNDLRWYIQRKGKTDNKVLVEGVKVWLRLLAPFAPFTCEELWSLAGEKDFISVAEWPRVDDARIDVAAEEQENLIVDLIADTLNILKATKITPTRICYYAAAEWKWTVYLKVLEKALAGEAKISEVMRELAADKSLKPHMKDAASLVPRVIKALNKLSTDRKANILKIKKTNEEEIIAGALGFLKERFNVEVSIYAEEDAKRYDPKQRAQMAMPYQPAIFIE